MMLDPGGEALRNRKCVRNVRRAGGLSTINLRERIGKVSRAWLPEAPAMNGKQESSRSSPPRQVSIISKMATRGACAAGWTFHIVEFMPWVSACREARQEGHAPHPTGVAARESAKIPILAPGRAMPLVGGAGTGSARVAAGPAGRQGVRKGPRGSGGSGSAVPDGECREQLLEVFATTAGAERAVLAHHQRLESLRATAAAVFVQGHVSTLVPGGFQETIG